MDIAGRTWVQSNQVRYVPSIGDSSTQHSPNQQLLESSEISHILFNEESCRPQSDNGGQATATGNGTNSQNTGDQKGNKAEQLLQFIRSVPTAPLTLVLQTEKWRKSKYKFYSRGCPLLKTIQSHIQIEYSRMTLRQLYNLTLKLDNVYYGTTDSDFYYDVKTSVYVLSKFLNFNATMISTK